jgi:hypothetical protein
MIPASFGKSLTDKADSFAAIANDLQEATERSQLIGDSSVFWVFSGSTLSSFKTLISYASGELWGIIITSPHAARASSPN